MRPDGSARSKRRPSGVSASQNPSTPRTLDHDITLSRTDRLRTYGLDPTAMTSAGGESECVLVEYLVEEVAGPVQVSVGDQ